MILTVLCYNLQIMVRVLHHTFFLIFSLFISGCSIPQIVIIKDPLTPEEHLQLGLSYERKGLFEEAKKHYEEASKKDARGFLFLGNLYFKNNKYEEAELNYKKAIEKDERLSDAMNNLAWLYFLKRKNLDEAESLILRAIEIGKTDAEKQKIYQETFDKIKTLKTK